MPSFPKAFQHMAWANLAAQAAEQISLAAAPIYAVLSLGAGPSETGLLAAIQALPYLLLSMPAGLLADRVSRARLMVAAEAVRTGAFVAMLGLAVLGLLNLWLLALLGFLGACGTVAFSVASPAVVPSLVPADLFTRANGRLELARSAAAAGGPALAGALVALAGVSAAFVLATVLSTAAVVLLLRLPAWRQPPPAQRHLWAELKEGAALVWRHPWLRPIALTTVGWNMAWYVLIAAYVPYAVSHLGLSAAGIGNTQAAYGVGLVLGAIAAPRALGALRFGRAIVIGPITSFVASMLMLLTLWFPSAWLAALAFFTLGATPSLWTIAQITLRQTVTPTAMLGRVSALFMTVGAGARPLGGALEAAVSSSFGLPACLGVVALGFFAQAAFVVRSPLVAIDQLPDRQPDEVVAR